jgi:DMSO/TMAO reductase YedYZ molybdopterin-dependent catalytic subunit
MSEHDPGGSDAFRPPMNPATPQMRVPLLPHQMTERLTPTPDVFVLAHLGIPQVRPSAWALTVGGLVERPCRLTLAELQARPKAVVEAVHQCCGSPLEPAVPKRRVANVRWGGVDLVALLSELGVDPEARYLWSYGLDGGEFAGTRCDWFVKDLPLQRLSAGEVLLAYELNDAPLPAEHGFPLRLVVPGFYGTNSVKWLWRLRLAGARASGPFTTTFYNDRRSAAEVAAGLAPEQPVWAQAPEAVIVAPAPGAGLVAGTETEVWGWAWGFEEIVAVELSDDEGASWRRAKLAPRSGWAWQRFALAWRPPAAGACRLSVRAWTASGRGQPAEGARNAVHSVELEVRPA